MDAKSFISKRYEAALAEYAAIEAEYTRLRDAAQAEIDVTAQWLAELALIPEVKASAVPPVQEPIRRPSDTWISARDLTPPALRQEQVA